MKATPALNGAYWGSLVLASIFGANLGDYLSDAVGLGHLSGIPILAAVLAAIFVAEAFTASLSVLFYWAAIITVRAAATNIGDSFRDFGIGFGMSIPLVFVALLAAVGVSRLVNRDANGVPVNGPYWVTMFLAGVLGTLVGDFMSYPAGLGNLLAAIVLGLPLLAILAFGRDALPKSLLAYWLTIALIRSAGTAGGDFIANSIGLGTSTAVTGLVFVSVILAFYGRGGVNVIGNAQRQDFRAAG